MLICKCRVEQNEIVLLPLSSRICVLQGVATSWAIHFPELAFSHREAEHKCISRHFVTRVPPLNVSYRPNNCHMQILCLQYSSGAGSTTLPPSGRRTKKCKRIPFESLIERFKVRNTGYP